MSRISIHSIEHCSCVPVVYAANAAAVSGAGACIGGTAKLGLPHLSFTVQGLMFPPSPASTLLHDGSPDEQQWQRQPQAVAVCFAHLGTLARSFRGLYAHRLDQMI